MRYLARLLLLLALTTPLYAGGFIKQSTATTIRIGPFIKTSDNTVDTGQTVTNFTVKLVKHSDTTGATVTSFSPTASGGSNDSVHAASGLYELELTTTNTDTIGRFDVVVTTSGTACYPVFDSYMVVGASSYSLLTAGTVGSIADIWAAQTSGLSTSGSVGKLLVDNVNAAVGDVPDAVLAATIVEPTIPLGASPTLSAVLAWMKVISYNKMTVTNTTKTLYNDASSALATQAISDNGTTATQDKAQ